MALLVDRRPPARRDKIVQVRVAAAERRAWRAAAAAAGMQLSELVRTSVRARLEAQRCEEHPGA